MEAISRAGRGGTSGADFAGLYEVRYARHRCAAFLRSGRQCGAGSGAVAGRFQIWFCAANRQNCPISNTVLATSSRADARAAAERMIGRRETYMNGAADFRPFIPDGPKDQTRNLRDSGFAAADRPGMTIIGALKIGRISRAFAPMHVRASAYIRATIPEIEE